MNEVEKKPIDESGLKKVNPPQSQIHIPALAFELGYIIAIPIVIFALIGRFADKAMDTSPIFILLGILLSLFITALLVWKKMKNLL